MGLGCLMPCVVYKAMRSQTQTKRTLRAVSFSVKALIAYLEVEFA